MVHVHFIFFIYHHKSQIHSHIQICSHFHYLNKLVTQYLAKVHCILCYLAPVVIFSSTLEQKRNPILCLMLTCDFVVEKNQEVPARVIISYLKRYKK